MAMKKKAGKKKSKKSQSKRSENARNAYKTGIAKELLAKLKMKNAGNEEEMPEDEEEQRFVRGRGDRGAKAKKRSRK